MARGSSRGRSSRGIVATVRRPEQEPTAVVTPPTLSDLRSVLPEAAALLARDDGGARNAQGGDLGAHGDPRLLARHLGHYLAAAELVADRDAATLLDVGSGVGGFAAWLGQRAGLRVRLVDHDPGALAAARRRYPAVEEAHTDLGEAGRADLVTAMEVLEHVPPGRQPAFLRDLLDRVTDGGLLVLSTPDESQYPLGWSGYAPHVGCVTAAQLAALLGPAVAARGARRAELWRVIGGPYDVAFARRWLEAVGNRAWTQVRTHASGLTARLEDRTSSAPATTDTPADLDLVRVVPARQGRGGSLLAVVEVP